jgi:DNA (cytosine-5)-methyltransferase 1
MITNKFTSIDLFAGCGGLSLGLKRAGFRGLFAVERHPDAFVTLETNLIGHFDWPEWLPCRAWDIKRLMKNYKRKLAAFRPRVDLLVGGPPCQGFSPAGRRNYRDSRNKLVAAYLDAVGTLCPRAVLLENVRGFAWRFRGVAAEAYSEMVVRCLRSLGYSDACGRLFDLADFGVPQHRWRYIIAATKEGLAPIFLDRLLEGANDRLKRLGLPNRITAAMALSDLRQAHGFQQCEEFPTFQVGLVGPSQSAFQRWSRHGSLQVTGDSHRYVNHRPRTVRVFHRMLEHAPRTHSVKLNARKRYGLRKRNATVLSPRRPAPTVTSIPDDLIHYSEPRVLTVRECARLQTFPDNFKFCGPYTTGGEKRRVELPRYTQVANAVPPLFAEQIGLTWKEILSNG